MNRQLITSFLFGLIAIPLLTFSEVGLVRAESEIDKLKSEINNRSGRLVEIEAEIAKFESELKQVGAEKKTLQSAINQLELERKKVNAEISRTENLISSTDLEINKIILEISRSEKQIDVAEQAIASIVRQEYKDQQETLLELLLSNDKLSDFWGDFEAHENVRDIMATRVSELSSLKTMLEEKRDENTNKRSQLSSLKEQYSDQNQVLSINKSEQSKLLEVTKSEEQTYQQLLSERKKAQETIIREMRDFESKLQFILDPNTVPTAGSRVFDWPLKNVIITQYFGGTEFAARNAAAYGGRPYHSGIDLGAPRGTPIHAPLTGTVRDIGNTDAVPGCLSWGKWTLIDHANGLATLYAHQDLISVSPGQKVNTGDVIGYIGNTGFSTGPHLHFTVYAKDGVTVRKFNEIKTATSCGPATSPVAATEAYLDPMLYLPPL